MMKRILLPILMVLIIGLSLISCDLFGDNDSDVKRLLFIDVTPNKSVFTDGDNIKDCITVKSFYSDGSDKTLSKESYSTDLLNDKVTSNTNTVKISYTEGGIKKEKTVPITVSNGSQTLISLDVKVSPTNYIFSEGDNVKEHLIVKGNYSDGSEKVISNTDYTVSPIDVTTNTNSLTVSYTEGGITKSNTLQIFVRDDSKTLFFIDVTLSPTDYVFTEGDDLKEHLKVEGFYSDGSVETITNTDCEITTTTDSVKVTYGSKTKTIPISVRSVKTLISLDVTRSPTNYIFSEGDNVKEHLIVKGYYSDSSENTITDTDYSTDITTVTSTTNSVTVTYETKTKTIPITVGSGSGITLNDIEVTINTDKLYEGDNIKDYLIVKGIYSDGVKTISKDGYSTNLLNDRVTTNTNSVTVTYTDGGVTKTKNESIILGNLSDYEINYSWFDNFSGVSENDVKSISFVKNKPSDVTETELITTNRKLSYYKKGTNLYVVGDRKIVVQSYSPLKFSDFPNVEQINFSNFDTSNVTDMNGMFYNCSNLTSVTFGDDFDTSKVTDMMNMFNNCKKLTSLDLSKFDTSNVTDMGSMFDYCEKLTSLTFGDNFKTSKVTNMMFMFDDCKKLTSLDLSKFDTSNVTDMRCMFMGCMELTSLTFGDEFNTSNVTSMMCMFDWCEKLTSLDLSGFVVSDTTDMNDMFAYCGKVGTKVTINPIYKDTFDTVLSDWSYDGVDTYTKITLIDIEVITKTDFFFEGENIKEFIKVKSVYSDGSKKTLSDTDYSISPSEIVYSTTTSVEISYTENGIEKKKIININVTDDTSDYEIDKNWFNNFSGVNKGDVTSISFIKEKPSDVTDEGITVGQLSYYKKGNDLYVVGDRKIVFPSDCSYMFSSDDYPPFGSLTTIDLSNVDTSNVTDMNSMFFGCLEMISITFGDKFDTSNVTDMELMFGGCYKLRTLNLSSFITSKVTKMDGMFCYCKVLTELDLSSFDTSNVTNMGNMFYLCEKLTSLDISSFNTSNVTNMFAMFFSCSKLTSITFKNEFDTSNVTDMYYMFKSCEGLTELDLSRFVVSDTSNMMEMFNNCGKVGTTVKINPIYESIFTNKTELGDTTVWEYSSPTFSHK